MPLTKTKCSLFYLGVVKNNLAASVMDNLKMMNNKNKQALILLFLEMFIIATMIFISNNTVKKLVNGINKNPSIE